jgi:hypothetical protein
MNINFGGRSATELEEIAAHAARLAADLRREQPSDELALAHGVIDRSYSTVRCGTVTSYAGEAIVTLSNGSRWRCVGRGPRGGAEWVAKNGFIEKIPVEEKP